jgi:ATP-dependent Clp protease, protease subunit
LVEHRTDNARVNGSKPFGPTKNKGFIMAIKKRKKEILYSFDTKQVLHTHRQLFLYGTINDAVANSIKQNLIAYDIISKQPITLWLSSPGGSCSAGLSIIEIMTHIDCPVITIISGEVCSMAASISVCGDVKWAFKDTGVWMQHSMSSGQADYLNYLKDRTAFLVMYNEILNKTMKEHTKLTEEDYKKIETGELWLTGDQLLEKGIVDKLL